MSIVRINRPEAAEYAPYYAKYISLVEMPNVVDALEEQGLATAALLGSLTEEQANHRYAPRKWSLKEVIGHLADAERIFSYRALRIARGDQTPLPAFEQDDYVLSGDFDRRRVADLAQELSSVRSSTLSLFRSFNDDAWTRRGVASQKEVSVRALAYITAGHELHHIDILKNRYL